MPPTIEIWDTPRVDNTFATGDETPDATFCQTNIMFATYTNGANVMWTTGHGSFNFSETILPGVTEFLIGDLLKFSHIYESKSTKEFITAEVHAKVKSTYNAGPNPTGTQGIYECTIMSLTPDQPL